MDAGGMAGGAGPAGGAGTYVYRVPGHGGRGRRRGLAPPLSRGPGPPLQSDAGGRAARQPCSPLCRGQGVVAPLWSLCAAAVVEAGCLQDLAALPRLRPAVVDALAAQASLRLDKRTLALLVNAGASQLRIRDFWELCYNEFPGWEFWRADIDRFPLRPGVPRMRIPDNLVRIQDGLLAFDPERWTAVFAWGGRLRSLILESQRDEDAHSGHLVAAILARVQEGCRLRHLALGFFDNVRALHAAPALGMRSLSMLELSHLPHFGDALVGRIWDSVPNLIRLRLNHLPISDHAFEGLPGHPRLRDLEVKDCPYVRLQDPFRPHLCRNLRALRLSPPPGELSMVASFREVQRMGEHMHGLEVLVLGVTLVPEENWSHVPCVLDLRMNQLERLRHLELYHVHQVSFPKRPWRYLQSLEHVVVDRANGFLLAVFSKIPNLRSLHVCCCEGLQPSDLGVLGSMHGLERLILGGLPAYLQTVAAEAVGGLSELRIMHLHRTEEFPACENTF